MKRILIVEDERPTAEDIQFLVKQIPGMENAVINIETTLDGALFFLKEKTIDVLLLDLNLNERDGFRVLKELVSRSFHTIIISANTNRAIEAFEYGVLDFVPKPYSQERLEAAFNRLNSSGAEAGHAIKYLSVKKGFEIQVIPIEDIRYFKSDNIYVELHLINGHIEIYDKTIKELERLLPNDYFRIHKSYIIKLSNIDTLQIFGGGLYRVVLKSGDILPVSRQTIQPLKKILGR